MNTKKIFKNVLSRSTPALNSGITALGIIIFVAASFYAGRHNSDMNIFAASGAIATTYGLLLMIQFTTIDKYIQQETIIANSTGMTGPPMTQEQAEEYTKQSIAAARLRIQQELKSELKGLGFTIVGTLIWAYGSYF